MFKIEMKAKVKDCVTGFEGIVTARSEYLTGCRQYLVTPTKLKDDGETLNSIWFDEDRLTGVDLLGGSEPENNGGPQSNPAPTK